MSDQTALLPEISMYEKLLKRGVDMKWYDRAKAKRGGHNSGQIPLANDHCYSVSIYILKQDGSLWTTTSDGKPYIKVREGAKELPKEVLICVCCKKQFNTFEEAKKHYE